MMPPNLSPIRVFAYGSLKRGGRYHSACCRGYCEVTPGRMLGRLYRQASGYAMLLVPREHVLAVGTADYAADAERLAAWRGRKDWTQVEASGEWDWIEGEIFTFDDPVSRLRILDELENFQPGGPSLYQRVIAPAESGTGDERVTELVWTYVAPEGVLPTGALRIGTRWP